MTSDWPHSPPHRLLQQGTYMVTTGTYLKERLFHTPQRLSLVHDSLLFYAKKHGWDLQAWAVFINHYHFIASSPEDPKSLVRFLQEFHYETAKSLNAADNCPGRKVWYEYFDTYLSYQKSYYARLNYVIENPVKHNLVKKACDYPWCSARWFTQMASVSFQKTIKSFKTDKLDISDEF